MAKNPANFTIFNYHTMFFVILEALRKKYFGLSPKLLPYNGTRRDSV